MDESPATRNSLGDLSQILEKQFNLRQNCHIDEIKSLEAKVKKLKQLVDKRQENRREVVSKRLDQILRMPRDWTGRARGNTVRASGRLSSLRHHASPSG